MTDTAPGRDYSQTLYLPKTDFPMKADLVEREPERLANILVDIGYAFVDPRVSYS